MTGFHRLQHIDCLYNDVSFFASMQSGTQLRFGASQSQLSGVSFELEVGSLWRRFEARTLQNLAFQAPLPPVLAPFSVLDAERCSISLEGALWRLITARRADTGLETCKYEPLSRLAGSCLPSFELSQLAGVAAGNEQFRLACRNFVSAGQRLSAFPLQVVGGLKFHAQSVFRALLSSPEGKNIVEAVGDGVRLGLRVGVYGYAEAVCAVWVVIAVVAGDV